jgi:hypothetical protein
MNIIKITSNKHKTQLTTVIQSFSHLKIVTETEIRQWQVQDG